MTTATHLFRWGPHYKLGVETIDFQHEQLAELLNRLNTSWRTDEGRAMQRALLGMLVDSVKEHFRTEEALMEEIGYPDLELHRNAHKFLAAQVLEFQAEFNARRTNLSESMMTYLKDWLRDHMLTVDKKMGTFIRKKQRTRASQTTTKRRSPATRQTSETS